MAGRGCSITVQVTSMDGTGDTQVEEISLPVALHSPLHVLRDHLREITGITSPSQVLILCDLTDPDRNRDVLLTAGTHDYQSLFECGIRDGSLLTLHPIGISRQIQRNQEANNQQVNEEEESDVYSVVTSITPAQADHSYNGVIFDIESRGPYETDIISFSFGGMLGRVRIYVRDCAWEPVIDESYGSWRSIGLATDGWECIADLMCPPSWDRTTEIQLQHRVTILPHARRAFYLHSNLPDDLGIQYQSFLEEDIIFEDERIVVYPGLGHTGSEPFDDVNGWYRAYRGLAGGIKYRSKPKHWTIHDHLLFPAELRQAVVTTLLCRERSLTHHIALALNPPILDQNMAQEGEAPVETTLTVASPTYQSPDPISFRYDFNLLDYESEERQFVENHATDQSLVISSDQTTSSINSQDTSAPSILIALPLHLVYYLMEFMDWDWYAEVTRRRRDHRSFSDGSTRDSFRQERTRRRRSFSGGSRFHSLTRNRYFDADEEEVPRTSSHGFNPLQALSGLISSSNRLYNFQDVIEVLLGGGSIEEMQHMFGGDDEDDDDDDHDDDVEDSKEDLEDYEPAECSMEEEEEDGDGYEHKSSSPVRAWHVEEEKNTEEGDEGEDGELTSVIRLRGLGGNHSDGSNI